MQVFMRLFIAVQGKSSGPDIRVRIKPVHIKRNSPGNKLIPILEFKHVENSKNASAKDVSVKLFTFDKTNFEKNHRGNFIEKLVHQPWRAWIVLLIQLFRFLKPPMG